MPNGVIDPIKAPPTEFNPASTTSGYQNPFSNMQVSTEPPSSAGYAPGGFVGYQNPFSNMQVDTTPMSHIPSLDGMSSSGMQIKDPFNGTSVNVPSNLGGTSSSSISGHLPSYTAVQTSGSSAAQNQQHTGFWGNLWNHTLGAVLKDASGGLKGLTIPAMQKQADLRQKYGPLTSDNPNVIQTGRGLEYKNSSGMVNPLVGLWQGLRHPGQTEQQYQQLKANNEQNMPAAARMLTNAALDTVTSPITYVPFGTVAKATGITPALKFALDAAKGTVKGADTAKAAEALNTASKAATAGANVATKAKPEFSNAINEWAGLNGGYKPTMQAVEAPKFTLNASKPGTFALKSANQQLGNLFNAAKGTNLPAGREYETLQNMLGTMSGKDGVSLDQLINQAGKEPSVASLINGAMARNQALSKYGYGIKDLFPSAFNKGTQTVMKAAESTPNFELRGGQLAVVPQAVKDEAQAAASVAKSATKSPYAAYGWQSKVGAPFAEAIKNLLPNGIPGVPQAANIASYVFKPIQGARQYLVDAAAKMHGTNQSELNNIRNTVEDIFKANGKPVPKATVENLLHAMEATPKGQALADPTLEALRQKVQPILDQVLQEGKSIGKIKGEINPAEYGVANYIPHIPASKFDESTPPFSDITTRKTGVDAGKSRKLSGTVKALNGQGQNFETDLRKVLVSHMGQMAKAKSAENLISEAMSNGLSQGSLKAGERFPGTTQQAVEYSHNGQTVLLPESEARFLQGLNVPKSEASQKIGKGYRGTVNALNRMMFVTAPFIHLANNLGTQTALHSPGTMRRVLPFTKDARSLWKEALTGVKPGSQMDQALKAGALHLTSELGHSTSLKKVANQTVKNLDKNGGSRLSKLVRGYNNFTPNGEKVYRTALYTDALKQGMTPAEAVDYVRSVYGGSPAPGAGSKFNQAMTGFLPFWNWTRTAIASNAKNALKNPAPYSAGYHFLNAYNEAMSGHPMSQNHNPLSVALPWSDNQGNQEYWTLYAPPFDAGKLGKDIATNGIRGPLDFALTRANPVVRYGMQVATGEQNPFASPLNKFNVDQYPQLAKDGPQYNAKGMAFGNTGYKLPAYLAQLTQDIANPLGYAMQSQGKPLRDLALEQLLGGYIGAPNPQSAIKEQQYNQREHKSQLKSWQRKQAQSK